mgnify:CR=1 FL=1
MLTVISPSKSLAADCRPYAKPTIPFFMDQIQQLTGHMKTMFPEDLEQLMKISPKLAELNFKRFQEFEFPFTKDNSTPALLTFTGDVFRGISTDEYTDTDFKFAQNHLRILSGLYGLLRPLDLMQPYRLEMGLRLEGDWGKNLYQFWADRITKRVNHELAGSGGDPVLVNLASVEYFKAIRPAGLNADLLNIIFKERKGMTFKVIAIHAKRARGLMSDFLIRNRINKIKDIKKFDRNGYEFNDNLSTERDWVFSRE